jgi:5-methylcytosine-specific restriction endonuclease McrA
MNKRVEFSKATKLAAFRRAHGRCERCSGLLTPGKFAYDHRNPAVFSGDAGAALENCQVLCASCHDTKTYRKDIPDAAKSNRIRASAAGIRRDRHIRAWRNFAGEIVRKPARREP